MSKDVYLNGGAYERAASPVQMAGQGFRDNVGIVLWVSQRERDIIRKELQRRVDVDRSRARQGKTSTYDIFDNNCSSNVADVLEMVGILAHDPRFFGTPSTPAELLAVLSKSSRFIKKNYYPKKK
ncbi:hypothetical protein ACTSKR_06490 [Chitinibacteraceae bacterium HSL-7]